MLFWKIYFWVLTILVTAFYFAVGFQYEWMVIGLVIDFIVIIGLFGFCWKRRIFCKLFWKIFFVWNLIWANFCKHFLPELEIPEHKIYTQSFEMFDRVFTLTLIILWLIALFLYAFRSSDIWD